MDLLEYCDKFAPEPSLRDLQLRAARLWSQAFSVLGNETRTDPTVAAVLSQVVMQTDEFASALRRRDLDPNDEVHRDVILVGQRGWGEYVLLIADDRLKGRGPGENAVLRLGGTSLKHAERRWAQSLGGGSPRLFPGPNERLLDALRTIRMMGHPDENG
jgi:hypothetical protein